MFRTIILQLSLSWKPPLAPKCPYFVPTKLQMHPVFIQASYNHPVMTIVDWIFFFRKHSEKFKENISNTWLGLIWLWKLLFYEEEKWNSQKTLRSLDVASLPTSPVEEKVAEYNDSLFYIYTSGTTGE